VIVLVIHPFGINIALKSQDSCYGRQGNKSLTGKDKDLWVNSRVYAAKVITG